jgi:vacuolar-type H+-ATPase subunit B/Vma2
MANRSAAETLSLAWELLAPLPAETLKRIPQKFIDKYHDGTRAT